MRIFITLFLTFFFTASAFANSEPTTQTPEPIEERSNNEIVLVSHVDFHKTLNMVILDSELKGITLKLEDQSGNEIFRTQVRTGETEVMEIDLSDIDGGTYQLKVVVDGIEQTENVIIPYK